MTSFLKTILLFTSRVAKENLTSEIFCPECGEQHRLVKWGFYTRYLFDGDDKIKIQRLRCLNRRCPKCTFRILPHPLLPVLRVPLCFLLAILSRHQEGCTVAELARKSSKSWAMVQRCLSVARRVQSFLKKEAETVLGTASPCLQLADSWTAFTHALSWVLFPGRI